MRSAINAAAVLLFLVATAASAASAPAQINPVATQTHSSAQTAPANGSAVANGVKALKSSYRAHRGGFVTVSKYSEGARHNLWLAIAGILVFALITLPRNARGVGAFYRQMISASPLADIPDAGADNVRHARAVLFFYLLFLLYQLVSFPLTLGRDNIVQFSADSFFQTALLLSLIWTYQRLKRSLRADWRNDPARREKMDQWLNEKLAGMNVRWRDIEKLALGVFAAGFAPVTLAHLPQWLDVLAAFGDRTVGA